MLDAKRIRQNPEELREALNNRNADPSMADTLMDLDESRRSLMQISEAKQATRNRLSDFMPAFQQLIRAKDSAMRSKRFNAKEDTEPFCEGFDEGYGRIPYRGIPFVAGLPPKKVGRRVWTKRGTDANCATCVHGLW